MLAAGAVLALYALGFVLASAAQALALAMPAWMAALIVGVVLLIVSGMLLIIGRTRLKQVSPKPEKTIETMKENIEWAKDQTR
jgi:cytochrome c biogenesis protein CcdA